MYERIASGTLKQYVTMQHWMQRSRWAVQVSFFPCSSIVLFLSLLLLSFNQCSHFLFFFIHLLHSLFPSHPNSSFCLPVSFGMSDPKGQMSLFQTTSLSLDLGCSDIKMYEEPYAYSKISPCLRHGQRTVQLLETTDQLEINIQIRFFLH